MRLRKLPTWLPGHEFRLWDEAVGVDIPMNFLWGPTKAKPQLVSQGRGSRCLRCYRGIGDVAALESDAQPGQGQSTSHR